MPRSTPEQRERARRLREKGYSLGRISYIVGFAPTTILRWLDAEKAERYRGEALQYRREHRRRLNEQSKLYHRRHRKGKCPVCGRSTPNAGVKSCKRCLREDQKFVWSEIETLWGDGLTARQIAVEMGRSTDSIQGHLQRMRKAGRNVPRRRKAG